MGKRVITLFLIPFLLFCALPVQAVEKEERSWQEEMMYFIMVDRFNNGDPSNDYEVDITDPRAYYGGDLKGITQKLDYIKDMGFTSIWLTPIFKNEPKGYHGYWIEDFYEVEEHFGTIDDFKELVTEAHKRDMKVILDFVVNHTGYQHPWVNDPAKQDWFHEPKGISNWNNQEQVETRQLFGLPDLAQENPETKEYLLDVAKWWIEETDIDGYRLDTVRHVPKWFWEEFATAVKSVKEDFFLLGEVWHDDPQYVADYTETGIDSVVDYPFFNEAARVFSSPDQSLDRLDTIWQRNVNLYENPFILGNFIDNHDNVRFTRRALEQKENPITRLKLALSYLYAAPGIPIVYYGTEIAMDGGEDPDNRRLMDFRTKDELVNYINKLSKIRSGNKALTHGDFELLYDNKGMAVFKRTFEENTVIIAINNSTVSQEVIIPTGDIPSNMSLTGLLSDDTFTEDSDGYEIVLDREKADIYILSEKQGVYLPFIILLIAVPLATFAFFWINKRVHRNRE
jgi:alpha-amylase